MLFKGERFFPDLSNHLLRAVTNALETFPSLGALCPGDTGSSQRDAGQALVQDFDLPLGAGQRVVRDALVCLFACPRGTLTEALHAGGAPDTLHRVVTGGADRLPGKTLALDGDLCRIAGLATGTADLIVGLPFDTGKAIGTALAALERAGLSLAVDANKRDLERILGVERTAMGCCTIVTGHSEGIPQHWNCLLVVLNWQK